MDYWVREKEERGNWDVFSAFSTRYRHPTMTVKSTVILFSPLTFCFGTLIPCAGLLLAVPDIFRGRWGQSACHHTDTTSLLLSTNRSDLIAPMVADPSLDTIITMWHLQAVWGVFSFPNNALFPYLSTNNGMVGCEQNKCGFSIFMIWLWVGFSSHHPPQNRTNCKLINCNNRMRFFSSKTKYAAPFYSLFSRYNHITLSGPSSSSGKTSFYFAADKTNSKNICVSVRARGLLEGTFGDIFN